MIVDILEWIKDEDLSKEELEILLKKKEIEYQRKFKTCINFDKNGYAWSLNATDKQREANKQQLNSIRGKALDACRVSLIIYNVVSKEKFTVNSIKEAESYIEQKHIYKNIKDKVYLPYNNYVAFLPEEYDPTKILITSCQMNASITRIYNLYNLATGETFSFPSKMQFSIFLTGSRNDKLYDKYSTFIDNNFYTAVRITTLDEFWNTPFVYHRTARSIKTCTLKDYYNALKNYTTNIALAKVLKCERRLVSIIFEEKSLEDRVKEIEETAGHLSNLFKIGKP